MYSFLCNSDIVTLFTRYSNLELLKICMYMEGLTKNDADCYSKCVLLVKPCDVRNCFEILDGERINKLNNLAN